MKKDIKKRLDYLRKQIRNENISYGEIAELQGLAEYIDKNDVELLEWAGVKEKNECKKCNGKMKVERYNDDYNFEREKYTCLKCGFEEII